MANIVVFLLQQFTESYLVESWLALFTPLVLAGEVWRLVTMAFCHGDFLHILFNMLFLVWFGFRLERMYGSREFFAFYFTCVVIASLANMGLDLATRQSVPAIGASGAIMGIIMLYAMHFPREKIYIWAILPVEIRWVALAYVFFDLMPVLQVLAGGTQTDNIAHAAHLGGLAFGYLYYLFKIDLAKFYTFGGRIGIGKGSATGRPSSAKSVKQKRRKGPKPKFTVVRSDTLEMKVDELLQKISEKGAGSLTNEEKEFLEHASKEYREREK